MDTNEKQSASAPEDAYIQQALKEAFEWYKQADSKAQTTLGFTGTFLSIVFGSIVLKAASSTTTDSAHVPVLIIAMVLSFYLSAAGLCVTALWSRGILRTRGKKEIYFFGHVANYRDGIDLLHGANLVFADPTRARIGWANEIIELARNTRRKHRLVNCALLLSSIALLGTVVLGLVIYAS
jgi:hypothetical protein